MSTDAIAAHIAGLTGGHVTVSVDNAGLSFCIDCGPRQACVGGWSGGEHRGRIDRGTLNPRMSAGLNLLSLGQWLDLLMQVPDWFIDGKFGRHTLPASA